MTKTRNLADLGGGFIQAGTGAVQLKENGIVQIILSGINALKPLRKEDDQIQRIKDTFKN